MADVVNGLSRRARTWAGLVERRATELLASVHTGGTALVVTGGFPAPHLTGATEVAAPPLDQDGGPYDTVLDTTRPEEPGDHDQTIAGLIRVCRPQGTIAVIACGGTGATERPGGPRSLARLRTLLGAAGWAPVRLVPFDLLGPLSPWRLALGGRVDAVLAELDQLLRWRSARAAVRLLERELVAALPCVITGRVLVVARRGAGDDQASSTDPAARLSSPEVARRLVALLQHDAVVRLAALVDAEVLAPLGVHFDLVRYLLAVTNDAEVAQAIRTDALRRGRCWFPGLDARRCVEALSHRMVRRTVEVLAGGEEGPGTLAGTLDYALLETCNAVLDRHLADPWTAHSSS